MAFRKDVCIRKKYSPELDVSGVLFDAEKVLLDSEASASQKFVALHTKMLFEDLSGKKPLLSQEASDLTEKKLPRQAFRTAIKSLKICDEKAGKRYRELSGRSLAELYVSEEAFYSKISSSNGFEYYELRSKTQTQLRQAPVLVPKKKTTRLWLV